MENFSLLVRKKYEELSLSEKKIFDDEFVRRKNKSFPDKTDDSDLALEILRDLALDVGSPKTQTSSKYSNATVNARFPAPKTKSGGNYLWLIILLLFAVLLYTKPDCVKMENKVVDKMLEGKPSMVSVFKNLFLGSELDRQKAEGVISNLLQMEGYKNIEIRDYDWVVFRKMTVIDSKNFERLITTYGLFGQTLVKLDYRDKKFVAEISSDNSKLGKEPIDKGEYVGEGNLPYFKENRPAYKPIKPTTKYEPIQNSYEENNAVENKSENKGRNSETEEKEEQIVGDSIKI